MKKIWLITGASSGLGQEMALSALRAGDRVIGTGRDVARAAEDNPEFAKLGGEWLQLDLASGSGAEETVRRRAARERGPVHWVVVNNAGYTLLGAAEDMSDGQISGYLDASVVGPVRVWRAMVPEMRRHRAGTLISISSIWGFVAKSGHMMYSAVKAATESLTESYADLLGPFGIRAMIVEPGGFRTPFAGNSAKPDGGISDDYRESVGAWADMVEAAGKDPTIVNGDPEKFGRAVVDAVEGRGLFEGAWAGHEARALRVQLGSDSYGLFGDKLRQLNDDYGRMARIASSTDVGS